MQTGMVQKPANQNHTEPTKKASIVFYHRVRIGLYVDELCNV